MDKHGKNSIPRLMRSALCALLALALLSPMLCAHAIGGAGLSPDGRDGTSTALPAVTPRVPISQADITRPQTDAAELGPEEKIVAEFLRSELKLNSAAIAGILANMVRESGFDPNRVGDGGEAFGLCQWRGRRRDRLLSYCESNSLDVTTISAQLNFLRDELREYYPDTLASLEGARDDSSGADRAAYTFCTYYETPKQLYTEAQARRNLASRVYYQKVSRYDNQEAPVTQIVSELMTADFLRNELKFNNAAAAGVLANIMDESQFNPKALGDKGRAYGICQWTGDRYESLRLFCIREKLEQDTLYAQLLFMKHELEGSHRAVADALKKCPDDENGAKQAVRIFCESYEVPRYLSAALVQRNRYVEYVYYPMLRMPLETTEFLSAMSARAADMLNAQKQGSVCPDSLEDKLLGGEKKKIY